jgi:acetyl esterase/lipase
MLGTILPLTPEYMAQVTRNISYGAHPLQQMDVHFPQNYTEQTPIVFLIHGGGFVMGRKEDFEIPAQLFCDEGFVVANLSHRLIDANWFSKSGAATRDGVKITDQLRDVDDAVRLFKRQARGWNVGTNRLYIAGHSAGAILGMLYMLQEGRHEGIRAAGNWAGITDLTMPTDMFGGFLQPWQRQQVQSMYDRMLDYTALAGGAGDARPISPYWVANKLGGRPVISLYPEKNVVLGIPGEAALGLMQTKRFHALLKSQGVPEQFSLYAGCDHSFRGCGPDTWQRCVRETAAFFQKH